FQGAPTYSGWPLLHAERLEDLSSFFCPDRLYRARRPDRATTDRRKPARGRADLFTELSAGHVGTHVVARRGRTFLPAPPASPAADAAPERSVEKAARAGVQHCAV